MTEERISRDLALERIRHRIRETQLPERETPLLESLGFICAQDLFAAHATPAEPRATVDGYALASLDTRFATQQAPTTLPVTGLIRPSTAAPPPLEAGRCAAMLTGGPLPPGADCVVPNEAVELLDTGIRLTREIAPMDHVRGVGSDLKAGTRIVRRGEELTPAVLAALAVSGVSRAKTYMPPRARVLALGNELSDLEAPPSPGKMPADNLLLAAGLLRARGVSSVEAEACPNELNAIAQKLAEGDAQCVITTGGTGPGRRDFIMEAARQAGFEPLFTALALTPGKSMFAAMRGSRLLFALPGTPWAVFALMHAVVLPAVCWLRGRTLPVPGPILARPSIMPNTAQHGWERLVACTNSALGAELQAQPLLERNREARLDMLQAQGLLIVSDSAEQGELLPMIPIWENSRGLRLG